MFSLNISVDIFPVVEILNNSVKTNQILILVRLAQFVRIKQNTLASMY